METTTSSATKENLYPGMPDVKAGGRALSKFETLPPFLFYAPLVLDWMWLAIKYRGVMLPTLANPSIKTGGLCGESKSEVLSLLGPEGRLRLAPFTSLETTGDLDRDEKKAFELIQTIGLSFPLVAKPDISCQGNGVKVIHSQEELKKYIQKFPVRAKIIFQKLIPHEGEAGVFYIRKPGESRGRIVSITLKYFPKVVGNGVSTLKQLIERDPRAGKLTNIYFPRHRDKLNTVLKKGEIFRLVFVGNHCKGAMFRNGLRLVTPKMEDAFEKIVAEIPHFHFGRFDVRFSSIENLQNGTDFSIIEFNGVGSEATHIWDKETKLIDAYKSLFKQLELAFQIGSVNRKNGFKSISPFTLVSMYLHEKYLTRRYPKEA